jgi:hypothetical protein
VSQLTFGESGTYFGTRFDVGPQTTSAAVDHRQRAKNQRFLRDRDRDVLRRSSAAPLPCALQRRLGEDRAGPRPRGHGPNHPRSPEKSKEIGATDSTAGAQSTRRPRTITRGFPNSGVGLEPHDLRVLKKNGQGKNRCPGHLHADWRHCQDPRYEAQAGEKVGRLSLRAKRGGQADRRRPRRPVTPRPV